MKAKVYMFRTAGVFALGVLAALSGCASSPTRQATGDETRMAPAFSASGGTAAEAPVPLRRVAPYYPSDLKAAGITGVVNVNCLIDENGKVQEAMAASSTDPRFNAPAVDALRKWTFSPALRAGVPIAARVNIPVKFTFDDE